MLSRSLPLAGLILATSLATVRAEGWNDRPKRRAFERPPRERLDDVVADWRYQGRGRVLSADTVEESGRSVHRIRILDDDGRVRGLRFDGDTGRPLSHHRERPRDSERYERDEGYDGGHDERRSYRNYRREQD